MDLIFIILFLVLFLSFITVLLKSVFPSNLFWRRFEKSKFSWIIYIGFFVLLFSLLYGGIESYLHFLDKSLAESITTFFALSIAIAFIKIIISSKDLRNQTILIRSKILSDIIAQKYSESALINQRKQIIEWYKEKLDKALNSIDFSYDDFIKREIRAISYMRVIDILAGDEYSEEINLYSGKIKDLFGIDTNQSYSFVDIENELMKERIFVE